MQSDCTRFLKVAGGVGVWLATILLPGLASAQRNDLNDDGAQVLTRGPVHEAFANLSESENAPGQIYARNPPDDIEELPPDQRPDGDNVSWVPGYWSFDDDREDYIWISGVWRDIPPNRQWVPGYWHSVRGGSQFVSGFWSDVGRTEVEYLPQPPAPLDVGPSSPQVGRNSNWSPGSWVWVEQRYAWQPGYWVVAQPNWVWTPAHYVWTPRGYVYVSAYWDYDISRRGVMFAPVYYSAPVYQRANYYYSPSIVIDISFAFGSLFVQSHSHHYYYGDYYDDHHRDRGYEPWYSRYDHRDRNDRYYREDPIFISYRSQQLRRDRDWDTHTREQYSYRREHVEARPAHTYARQSDLSTSRRSADREQIVMARPLDQVVKSESQHQRFRPIDSDRRKEYQTQARDVKQYRAERKQIEADPESGIDTTQTVERVQQPTSSQAEQPRTHDVEPTQTQRGQSGKKPSTATDSNRDAVRIEQPESPSQTQQQGRDADQGQTQRGQSQKQPRAVSDSSKDTAAPTQPQENQRPARDVNQSQPAAKQVTVEPETAQDGAKNSERTRPVKKNLRQSPIAAKQAKSAPAAPDMPKPEANAPEPAANDNSKATEPAGKESPAPSAQPEKSKGRGAKPDDAEKSQKNDARNPK